MKTTTSACALAMVIALSGASLAQTGGGAGSGGASGGAASSGSGGAGTGAGTGGGASGSPIGAAPGTTTSGPSLGAGSSPTTPAPATGGVPTSPGALENQIQSNQNQQTRGAARDSGSVMQPSTRPSTNPPVSGSARDAAARARTNAQCEAVLARRSEHTAEQVAACERSTRETDPAAELDRRLQRENSRAVNSICRGC